MRRFGRMPKRHIPIKRSGDRLNDAPLSWQRDVLSEGLRRGHAATELRAPSPRGRTRQRIAYGTAATRLEVASTAAGWRGRTAELRIVAIEPGGAVLFAALVHAPPD